MGRNRKFQNHQRTRFSQPWIGILPAVGVKGLRVRPGKVIQREVLGGDDDWTTCRGAPAKSRKKNKQGKHESKAR